MPKPIDTKIKEWWDQLTEDQQFTFGERSTIQFTFEERATIIEYCGEWKDDKKNPEVEHENL